MSSEEDKESSDGEMLALVDNEEEILDSDEDYTNMDIMALLD